MPALIGLLVSLIVLGLILAVAWWCVSMVLPSLPPPIQLAVKVVFALIVLVALLTLLFGGWSFPWYAGWHHV